MVELCADPYTAAAGADAVVLVTEWAEFRQLDLPRLRDQMQTPVFVDGRNVFEPDAMRMLGFVYAGIGRGAVAEVGGRAGTALGAQRALQSAAASRHAGV